MKLYSMLSIVPEPSIVVFPDEVYHMTVSTNHCPSFQCYLINPLTASDAYMGVFIFY